MELNEDLKKFILRWSELASHWGLNRTEALIHALLFISPAPLTMEEIADALAIARSNASTSLKELENWKIIEQSSVMGDRRKQYMAVKDVWVMFRNIFTEQKRRGIEPFIGLLNDTHARLKQNSSSTKDELHAGEQIEKMMDFFETSMAWYSQLEKLPTPTIRKYLSFGSKVSKLIKPGK